MAGDSPFAPGQSPFHIKGVVYHATHQYFADEVTGGLEALWAQLPDPALLAFAQQKFLPSSWYDVLPIAQLISAESRAARQTLRVYLRARSAYQARKDIGGVYRFLLRLASPEMVAARLPRLITQIFDFGQVDVTIVEPGHMAATLTGYPAVLWEWYSIAFEVYCETALKLAGAATVSVTARPPEAQPSNDGVKIIQFVMEARWS
jgi:hypothetical protein